MTPLFVVFAIYKISVLLSQAMYTSWYASSLVLGNMVPL